MQDRVVLFLICGLFVFNIFLLKERTPLGTHALPIQIFGGIVVNVTSSWDRGMWVRNTVPMGMLSTCLNGAVVGHATSGGKSEIARVKVGPFLPVVSARRVRLAVFSAPWIGDRVSLHAAGCCTC